MVQAATFGAADGTVGVGSGKFEAAGALLKVNLLFPNAWVDLGGEHDDRGVGEGGEDRAVDIFDNKGNIGMDVGRGN